MTRSSTLGVDTLLEAPRNTGMRPVETTLSRKVQFNLFILALVLSDVMMTVGGFTLAYWIRFELSLPLFQLDVDYSLRFYGILVLALVPTWLLIFAGMGLYQRKNLLGGTREYAIVSRATTVGLLLVIVAGFLEPNLLIARGWLLLAWAFTSLFTGSGRFVLRRVVYSLRQRGYFLTPALLIGANEEGQLLGEQLVTWRTSGLHLLGVVDNDMAEGESVNGGLELLGSLNDLDRIIEGYGVEELIIATSALSRKQMLAIFERYGVSDKVNVRMSSGLFEIITTGLEVKEMGYVPLVSVNKVRLTGSDRILKLILDYGLTIPGLILISPFLLLIAIAIKLDSPGSVIHRRRVMGINGRQFDAYKFRTMYSNGDEILAAHPELLAELARNHKLVDDPRVTRVGRFLRRYSLDELPQLINVLKGDMSLVGPRMISPEETSKYNQWSINLLTVRPGLTGLWQVSGRSNVSYDERVQLDMYYIRNWTIWLDLHLLLQTFPAIIKGHGAY